MAMNLLNPIQLLRGTNAAINAAQGKEGTLYYNNMYRTLDMKGSDALYHGVRTFDTPSDSPAIFVDAENGDDSNSGIDVESPVKTIDKAFWLCNLRNSIVRPSIMVRPGSYESSITKLPDCYINGDSKDTVTIQFDSIVAPYGKALYFSKAHIQINGLHDDVSIIGYNSYVYFDDCYIKINADSNGVLCSYDSSYMFISNCMIDTQNLTVASVFKTICCSALVINGTNNIVGNTNVTAGTAAVYSNSIISIYGNAVGYSGTITGRKYTVNSGGVIETSGIGANAFPGTIDGVLTNGGAYY